MGEKHLFYGVVEDFISTTQLTAQSYDIMTLLYKTCRANYGFTLIQDVDNDFINEAFILYVIPKVNKLNIEIVDDLSVCFLKFQDFLKSEYGIEFSIEEISYQLQRILSVYDGLSKFLENPILSYSPLIIDIDNYKKSKERKKNLQSNRVEIGHFEIVDLLSNNYVLIRNIQTGRFLKLYLNKLLFLHIVQKDILHAVIRQRPYMGWEIEEIKGYYPPSALKYLRYTARGLS